MDIEFCHIFFCTNWGDYIILFLLLLMWCITSTDLCMLNHPCFLPVIFKQLVVSSYNVPQFCSPYQLLFPPPFFKYWLKASNYWIKNVLDDFWPGRINRLDLAVQSGMSLEFSLRGAWCVKWLTIDLHITSVQEWQTKQKLKSFFSQIWGNSPGRDPRIGFLFLNFPWWF